MSTRGLHLLQGGRRDAPLVAVIAGGVQMTHSARDNASALARHLGETGCESVVVEWGPRIAEQLRGIQFDAAISAVRDGMLPGGSVEQLCAAVSLPCLGPNEDAIRRSADKSVASALLRAAGIAVPSQRTFSRFDAAARTIAPILDGVSTALYVKPRHGVNGTGVKRVKYGASAAAAITNTFNYDDAIVVESEIVGDEFTVVLTGDSNGPHAIGVARQSYKTTDSHRASWGRSFSANHRLSAQGRALVVDAGRMTMQALALDGLATVDVIVDEAQTAWVIDVDATLDWREGSALAACLESSDLSMVDLLRGIIRDAPKRSRKAA